MGGLPGVPGGTEVLAIEQKISKFLGPDGPRWELERAPADNGGREVLFIIVDPPKDGDTIYTCHADFQSESGRVYLTNGEIYVRGPGETRKAKAPDVAGLVARASSGSLPSPEFVISLRGTGHGLDVSDDRLDEYVESQIAESRKKHVEPAPTPSPHPLVTEAAWNSIMLSAGMNRISSDSFERLASEWEKDTRSSWIDSHVKLAAAVLPRVVIEVANRQSMFLEAVRIDLIVSEAYGVRAGHPDDVDLGKIFPPVIKESSPFLYPKIPFVPLPTPAIAAEQMRWKNHDDGDLRITVELEDLRPETPWTSGGDLVVLALRRGATSLSVRWRATAKGYHETFDGTAELPVSGDYTLSQLAEMLPA